MLQQCGNKSSGSFSIFFPMSAGKQQPMEEGSSVDCTLSLGTPSTRHTATSPSSSSSMPTHLQRNTTATTAPSFCWDIISQSKAHYSSASRLANNHPHSNNITTTSANTNTSSNLGGDPLLLARRCANCDTTSTPLWRNGPRGPKSLCNACGIRYKKEERRAAASSSSSSSTAAPTAANEGMVYSYQRQQQQQQQPWGCYPSSVTVAASGRDQMDHDDMDQVPYLSWRLNVVPPTTLFQYQ